LTSNARAFRFTTDLSTLTSMTHSPLLQLDRVGFTREGLAILHDISWQVEQGEHWALLGPNGSGKTTLLKIICGYLWPNSGIIRRLGHDLIDLRQLRQKIGWISADLITQIPPHEKVLETVVSGRFAQIGFKNLLSTQPTRTDLAAARDRLDQLECGQFAERRFGTLSQGEKQKVLLARARMAQPLLLILDEPCAGMDPGTREQFLASLDTLARDKTAPTILLVTHHVEEIMPSLQNTLVLKEGQVLRQGPTHEVLDIATLQSIYGTQIDRIETSGGRRWPIWK